MTHQKAARITSGAFAAFWLAGAVLIADRRPPLLFAALLAAILACAWVVHRRVLAYLAWRDRGVGGLAIRALGEGALGGLLVAALFSLSPGEPQVHPGLVDYAIWFGVMALLGAANAITAYGIAAWMCRAGAEASTSRRR